jgi:hypothetical protein
MAGGDDEREPALHGAHAHRTPYLDASFGRPVLRGRPPRERGKAVSYSYEKERPGLFTESGQVRFMKIRDRAQLLLKEAGAFRMQELGAQSWEDMACVDRMVELGEIVELKRNCFAQYRVFARPEVHNL